METIKRDEGNYKSEDYDLKEMEEGEIPKPMKLQNAIKSVEEEDILEIAPMVSNTETDEKEEEPVSCLDPKYSSQKRPLECLLVVDEVENMIPEDKKLKLETDDLTVSTTMNEEILVSVESEKQKEEQVKEDVTGVDVTGVVIGITNGISEEDSNTVTIESSPEKTTDSTTDIASNTTESFESKSDFISVKPLDNPPPPPLPPVPLQPSITQSMPPTPILPSYPQYMQVSMSDNVQSIPSIPQMPMTNCIDPNQLALYQQMMYQQMMMNNIQSNPTAPPLPPPTPSITPPHIQNVSSTINNGYTQQTTDDIIPEGSSIDSNGFYNMFGTMDPSMYNYYAQMMYQMMQNPMLMQQQTAMYMQNPFMSMMSPLMTSVGTQPQMQQQAIPSLPQRRPEDYKEDHPDECKLFVGGMPGEVNDMIFKNYFQQFGPVRNATVVKSRDTGLSRGFGFIEFKSKLSLEDVLNIPKHEFFGKRIDMHKCLPDSTKSDTDGAQFRVFVGGLDTIMTEDVLREALTPFGTILNVSVIRQQDGRSRGFAFVQYSEQGPVDMLLQKQAMMVNGRKVFFGNAQARKRQGGPAVPSYGGYGMQPY